MEIRTPDIIEKDIAKLEKELKKSEKHYKTKRKRDASLLIPYNLRQYFPRQEYFNSHMQKLVWEEDD